MSAMPPVPQRLTGATHYHQAAGSHPSPRLVPAGFELVELVTEGRGWVQSDGRWHEVVAGQLIWHVAGDETIGRSDFERPYRCLAATFSVADTTQRRCPHLSLWPELDEVRAFTREVVQCFVDDMFEQHLLMLYVYSRLLYQVRRHHHGRLAENVPLGLLKVLDEIDRHYSEDLTLETLAEVAGWSIPHLHQMFRDHLEVSPHHYLIQRRMRAAKEQLTATDRPIKQIAAACGYGYSASFCRQFRQETGLTPGEYRQRHAYDAALTRRR